MTTGKTGDLSTAHVGMVGAGQLARMSQRAAIDLGVHLEVLAHSADDPGVLVGMPYQLGAPDDREALMKFGSGCDVMTFDHELIPTEHLNGMVEAGYVLHPSPEALRFAQDKLHQRRQFEAMGFPVPPFAPAPDATSVATFAEEHGWPLVMKARRGGYDGRGVAVVNGPEEAAEVLAGDAEWYVEKLVEIEREVAVLGARRPSGQQVTYPLVETIQRDGILVELIMPARVDEALRKSALELGHQIIEKIDAVGIVAVELFITTAGDLLINELALRPHNSGHATIEASTTSQFHNHLRAVLDWPLGDTAMRAPAAGLVNILGGHSPAGFGQRMARALEVPCVSVHLYGKKPRPARKVGHVTALAETTDEAIERARAAARALLS